MIELLPHQEEVIDQLGNGKILHGGVGAGKSATVLAYYMKYEAPRHIFVFTTAKKRDSLDWEGEAARFGIGDDDEGTVAGWINVDSWNNMWKYKDLKDAFIIFDEQRLVGYGAWVSIFLHLAKSNHWVLLSATPGDTWMDYVPVFIANGYYKNKTDFCRKHVRYEPFIKFPVIKEYLNVTKLQLLRNEVLVEMPYFSENKRYVNWIDVGYNKELCRKILKERWNPYLDCPIKDAAEMFRLLRRVANSDPSRLETLKELLKTHPKVVVFYNFDYELEILRTLKDEVTVAEWNGHRKDQIPECDSWVYLVQYIAGAEGWNCTETNAMILYSLTYSYKNFIQAQGRIDRLFTVFSELYYYVFVSNLKSDLSIRDALRDKRDFNEKKFIKDLTFGKGDFFDF